MIRYFRNKSLLFSSSILISSLLLIIALTMNLINYASSRQAYFEQINQLGQSLRGQVEANGDVVSSAIRQLETKQAEDWALDKLKRQLDAMAEDSAIENAFLLLPDVKVRDGRNYMDVIQTNQALQDAGILPGVRYSLPDVFKPLFDVPLTHEGMVTPTYDDDLGTWISYLAPIQDDEGRIVAMIGFDYAYDQVQLDQLVILLCSLGIGLLLSAVAIAIIITLVGMALRPLRLLTELAKEAANGKLTATPPVPSKNEIGQLTASFNDMIDGLRQLVTSMQDASDNVMRASFDLLASAGQTADASQAIADSIQAMTGDKRMPTDPTMQTIAYLSEQQLSSMRRVSLLSQQLRDLASKLDRVIRRFHL